MIELLGIKVAYETLAFVALFAASEIVALTPLKANSIIQLLQGLVATVKPVRTEDEKVAAVKAAVEGVKAAVEALGK